MLSRPEITSASAEDSGPDVVQAAIDQQRQARRSTSQSTRWRASQEEVPALPRAEATLAARREGQLARHRRARLEAINKRNRGEHETFGVGQMDLICAQCGARHWHGEQSSTSSASHLLFQKCCAGGKVILPSIGTNPPFPLLAQLLEQDNPRAKRFREHIRNYNNAFSFVSLGAKLDPSTWGQRGVYSFRVSGELMHRMGSLLPAAGEPARFAQIYTCDTETAITTRMGHQVHGNLDRAIVSELQAWIGDHNPYAQGLKHSMERMAGQPAMNAIRIQTVRQDDRDSRRYNLPTVNEVAICFLGEEDEMNHGRDIVIQQKEGPLQRVSELHQSWLPLRFPLLHVNGEDGWHPEIPLAGNQRAGDAVRGAPGDDADDGQVVFAHRGVGGSMRVTLAQWMQYHVHVRTAPSLLHRSGRLFQEYIVDFWAQIEQGRIRWIRLNQATLRADTYAGIADAIDTGVDAQSVGRRTILPSSFNGSSRNMNQLFQDAMAIVRTIGFPSFFVTVTCNPQWAGIQDALLPGQTAQDRPELVARVFNLTLKHILREIEKDSVLGTVIGCVWVIEFQKRGLPHAHILLIMDPASKPITTSDVDQMVSAELPDREADPRLWDVVTTCMLHGPCGTHNPSATCTAGSRDGKCSKHYPRCFRAETSVEEEGYPNYRRRDNGLTCTKRGPHGQPFTYTNENVVPHNPYLSRRFNCHINVEVTTGIHAVKYIYKYIYKGHDRAVLQVRSNQPDPAGRDETAEYLDARYVSPPEAIWRTMGYLMHKHSPNVVRLQVHLPDQQLVHFDESAGLPDVQHGGTLGKTMLTEFFTFSSNHPQIAVTYADLPTVAVWKGRSRQWDIRKKGTAVGRVYFVQPREGERFYLRMLLNSVLGPKSWNDLRTHNGHSFDTFKEACIARALLESDNEFDICLQEAATFQTGHALRQMFAVMLCQNQPARPAELFAAHYQNLSDDCRYQLTHLHGISQPTEQVIRDLCLTLLDRILQRMGSSLEAHQLPLPTPGANFGLVARVIQEEKSYDPQELEETVNQAVTHMNPNQQHAYACVLTAVQGNPGIFFLQGPGGTGKTFVENALLAAVRKSGGIALAVASSGIAALLLKGGRTAHSRFRIPIKLTAESTLPIGAQTELAQLFRETNLIIWDEAPMQHRHCAETVSRALQDLRQDMRPFGGITVVFGGDWAQTLPVIQRGTEGQVISAALFNAPFWHQVQTLTLSINMRLLRPGLTAPDRVQAQRFAAWLQSAGRGGLNDTAGLISLPTYIQCLPATAGLEALIAKIYPYNNLLSVEEAARIRYFQDRAILGAKNSDVGLANSAVLLKLPGQMIVLKSADRVLEQREESNDQQETGFPTEYLNSLDFPSLPLHKLELKVGAPLMLLRNLDPSAGLCNGTRLLLLSISPRVLQAKIITGDHAGTAVLIPRIALDLETDTLPFVLRRLQFPVRLAFAMTINKAQGQSLDVVGLDLRAPAFAHGQLYVALSRATNCNNVHVLLDETEAGMERKTQNVVYKRVSLPQR